MATPTGVLHPDAAIGNREDLSDVIWDVSPTDTPVLSMISRVGASAQKHEWLTKALKSTSGDNKAFSGDDIDTSDTARARVRLFNYCQIFTKSVLISDSQKASDPAGTADELDLQLADMMAEIKKDVDERLTDNNLRVEPDASTAGEIGGIQTWVGTNDDFGAGAGASPAGADGSAVRTGGTARALVESQFKNALALAYTSGGNPNMVVTGAFNKQQFSMFSGGSTRHQMATDERINASVDFYQSDFGGMAVLPSRQVDQSTLLVLDDNLLAVAELQPLHKIDIARTGMAEKCMLAWECTLEVRNEAGLGGVFDLTTT